MKKMTRDEFLEQPAGTLFYTEVNASEGFRGLCVKWRTLPTVDRDASDLRHVEYVRIGGMNDGHDTVPNLIEGAKLVMSTFPHYFYFVWEAHEKATLLELISPPTERHHHWESQCANTTPPTS